jgi:anti-sigma factor RsiW
MNCAELEILLCDYLDGTLGAEAKAQVEAHLAQCSGCAQMARDVQAATGFMERVAEVEPPPELLTRILFEWRSTNPVQTRQPGGLRRLFGWILHPELQPRFVMGCAMTILSVAIVLQAIGVSSSGLKSATMNPAVIWRRVDDQLDRGWQKTAKFYQNMRLVYEIQTQLRDWTQKETELRGRTGGAEGQTNAAPAPNRETRGPGTEGAPEANQR